MPCSQIFIEQLSHSITTGDHISIMAKILALRNIDVEWKHWIRFTFLVSPISSRKLIAASYHLLLKRNCLVEFNNMPKRTSHKAPNSQTSQSQPGKERSATPGPNEHSLGLGPGPENTRNGSVASSVPALVALYNYQQFWNFIDDVLVDVHKLDWDTALAQDEEGSAVTAERYKCLQIYLMSSIQY